MSDARRRGQDLRLHGPRRARRGRPARGARDDARRARPQAQAHAASRSSATTTATLPKLTVRGSELNQVWTNLLDNAIDALGEHGTITITHAPRRRLRRDRRSPTTGRASRRRSASAIFDPFFTTKDVGAGHRPRPGHRAPASSSTATAARSRVDSEPGGTDVPRLAPLRAALKRRPTVTLHPPRHDHDHRAAGGGRRAARTAWPPAASGCTCGSASHAGTSAAATARPNRHASAHAASSGHPIIRSLEPGEDWSWCFVDEVAMRIRGVTGESKIPPSPLGG